MYLPRKSLLPLALLVGLFGTPTLAPAHAPRAPGGGGHPPVVQLATVAPDIRRRRRARRWKVRGILSCLVARLRDAVGVTRPAGTRIRSRRAHHNQIARGPPRSCAV